MLQVRGGYFSTEKIGFINPTRVFKLTIVSHGLAICTKFGVIFSLSLCMSVHTGVHVYVLMQDQYLTHGEKYIHFSTIRVLSNRNLAHFYTMF